ncbi:MAG: hypothetical protein ACK56I_35495, partial [bacterium]
MGGQQGPRQCRSVAPQRHRCQLWRPLHLEGRDDQQEVRAQRRGSPHRCQRPLGAARQRQRHRRPL